MNDEKTNKKSKRFDHVYAVLRYDSNISDYKQAISVLKIFVNESDAIAEAVRLNELRKYIKSSKSFRSEYFVQQTRIPKGFLRIEE